MKRVPIKIVTPNQSLEDRKQKQTKNRNQKRQELLLEKRGKKFTVEKTFDIFSSIRELDQFYGYLTSNNTLKIKTTLYNLRYLSSIDPAALIKILLEKGILKLILDLLNSERGGDIYFEIFWILINITSLDDSKNVIDNMIVSKSVDKICSIIQTSNPETRKHGIWLLTNVVNDSVLYRDYVLNTGILQYLTRFVEQIVSYRNTHIGYADAKLQDDEQLLIHLFTALVSQIPLPIEDYCKQIIPVLKYYLIHSSSNTRITVILAMEFLSDAKELIPYWIDNTVIQLLVDLLLSPENMIKHAAIRIIGNVVSNKSQSILQKKMVTHQQLIGNLRQILRSEVKDQFIKEISWCLSHMVLIDCEVTHGILRSGMIHDIVADAHQIVPIRNRYVYNIIYNIVSINNPECDRLMNDINYFTILQKGIESMELFKIKISLITLIVLVKRYPMFVVSVGGTDIPITLNILTNSDNKEIEGLSKNLLGLLGHNVDNIEID